MPETTELTGTFNAAWAPSKQLRVPYQQLRPRLRTGDLVLMSGGGDFSALIKLVTGSKWSHVAMVVRPSLEEDAPVLLWESCGETVATASFDEYFSPWKDKIKAHGLAHRVLDRTAGDIVVRHLCGVERSPAFEAGVQEIIRELAGRPYEDSWLELARPVLAKFGVGWDGDVLETLFCSECFAETYRRMKLLPAGRSSSLYRPGQFAFDAGMALQGSAWLGQEQLIQETF